MKIKEFIEKYNKDMDIKEILTRTYIPIAKKRNIANVVLNKCVDTTDGFAVVDECYKDICFMVAVISAYTSLEFSEDRDGMLEEYDALCESGWFDTITATIEEDYMRLVIVVEQEENALLSRNSIEASVAKVATNIINTVETLTEKLEDFVEDIDINNILPEGKDVAELFKLIDILK